MTGRPPSCRCGECRKCRARAAAKRRYDALTPDERRAVVAARDPEKVRAADRARYYRNAEARRALARAYKRDHPDENRKASRRWIESNPEKRAAQVAVGNAVRDGRLERQACEACGTAAAHAHHEDYSKPLDVRWLCRSCHMATHRMAT